jgi:hypothetical protein
MEAHGHQLESGRPYPLIVEAAEQPDAADGGSQRKRWSFAGYPGVRRTFGQKGTQLGGLERLGT